MNGPGRSQELAAKPSKGEDTAMPASGPARLQAPGVAPAPFTAFVDGIALWTPAWPGWEVASAALRGKEPPAPASAATARPAPGGLAANERRRAPDSVLVALLVAEQAVAMSGHAADRLASVFTSAHGDLPIIDALARTLASEPRLLSPTRFHHSVHNAPSGYWAMAAHSHAASTALAAFECSFAAGLLEALVQVASDEAPVLLAGCDTEATGPLASVNSSRGLLGVALVLAPRPGARTRFALRWRLSDAAANAARPATATGRALAGNALADALPLFEALALGESVRVELHCGPETALQLSLQPSPAAA